MNKLSTFDYKTMTLPVVPGL